MATTQNTFTGDGSTTAYSFTFEYLKAADVKVSLDAVDTTAFTLSNATTVNFTTAPTSGAAIRIYRDTAADGLQATFYPGSAIRASDLNNNFTQNLYVTQEADFNVDTANTTAGNAVTTANNAVTTANSAVTTANNAVSSANAAVSTANTADTNASAAVVTANAANATSASAASDATNAVATANAASALATTADTNATTAVNTANSAATDASNAVATANAASTLATTADANASTALATANTADTNASTAVTTSNTASTAATNAVNTANAASAAVSNAVLFTLISNVASIPGSPSNNDYIEIGNSTGIESFTPLSALPTGFVGAATLTVRLRYETATTSWVYMSYFANDSEARYLTRYLPVVVGHANSGSGQITLNCENNSHGVKIKGPPHSAAASYTLTLPDDIGTAGQVLQTDGTSGNLTWNSPDQIIHGTSGYVRLQDSSNNDDELLTTLENQLVKRDYHTHSFIYSPQYYEDNIELRGDKSFTFQVNTGGGGATTSFKKSQSATTSVAFTVPDADGTVGQAIVTDGSGNLSFADVDTAFVETPQTLTTNKTIPANTNALMVGPVVTLSQNQVINVGTNSKLTVLGTPDDTAPTNSPAFTGTPTAPTAPVGTNTTQIATTAFVAAATPDISGKANTSDIGVTIQEYDADTAFRDTTNTYTQLQTMNAGLYVDGFYRTAAEAVAASDIDLSTGSFFKKTISGNTTFTFSSAPGTGHVGSFTVELTHNSGTVTWPATVKWPAGTAPTLTSGKTHLFAFVTTNAGSTYHGAALVDY